MDAGDPHPFEPDWTLSPGVFLRRVMAERKLTEDDVMARTRLLTLAALRGVLEGIEPVTDDIAIELSKATGVPSSFWRDAEAGYRADLARGAKDSSEET